MPSTLPLPDDRPSLRISMLIVIVASVVFLGVVCTFGFATVEEKGLLTQNPNLNPATLSGLWNHWRGPHIYLYIPATYTLWWFLALIGRTTTPDESGATLNPWLFHSANLLLHIACSLLVLQLLRRLTRRNGPALVGALLFALHPVQVEAVAWATGTKDVLCGFFSFAALLMYVINAQTTRDNLLEAHDAIQPGNTPHAGAERQRRPGSYYALGLLFLLLALLSKPAASVVPILAAIIDYLLIGRELKSIARSVVPWFALAVPFLLITRVVQPATEIVPAPLWARPLIAADALAFYLWKIVWPFGLTIDYSRSPQAIFRSGAIYWTWLIPAAVSLALVVARKRWLTTAALLFVVGLLPVLGLTTFLFQRFSTVADRFVYLSMFAVALAGAWIVSLRWTRRAIVTAAALLVLLGIRSTMQALTWRDTRSIYGHAVAISPDSANAQSNWGAVLWNEGDAAGEAHFRRAIELDPQYVPARENLALVLRAQGKTAELDQQLHIIDELKRKESAATRP